MPYADAAALQEGLWSRGHDDWLLLLEHPHTYTLGVRTDPANVLVDPATVGAEVLRANRGGDVTYHGPGQLVGYPIRNIPLGKRAMPSYVHSIEQILIDSLIEMGLPSAGRLEGYPGVWIDAARDNPRKIAAIGVRVSKERSMHGFALNVHPDMSYFTHIIPCGIADKPVTSMADEGIDAKLSDVVKVIRSHAQRVWGYRQEDVSDVAWRVLPGEQAAFTVDTVPTDLSKPSGQPVRLLGRLAQAGVDPNAGLAIDERKPSWLKVPARMGEDYRKLRSTMRSLDLITVCEEAGCPNIYECWAEGTATFMINGERCTRACGFCLVDTRKPLPADPSEPRHVAEAVAKLGLAHAVITTVARDDLADDGAGQFAATVAAIREMTPGTRVELLVSDCKGHVESLQTIFDARPDVLNHNIETVARLQRAVRPSAAYSRSLSVLARAKKAGLVTKSGIIVGMGETPEEVRSTIADLAGVGVDIVTIGQYLRPTARHLPVARWWRPEEFSELAAYGESLGISHVEASPLTRSSYHARTAADAAGLGGSPAAHAV